MTATRGRTVRARGIRLTAADIGRPGLAGWLAAHGLHPDRVCALPGAEVEIRDGTVHAVLYVVDARGRRLVDSDGPPAFVIDWVSVPLRHPLPAHLGTPIG